jgi:hypothetical protein
MNDARLGREEIALRIFCAFVRSGRPVGPENIRESFALAQAFEEHSDKVGGRPYRSSGRSAEVRPASRTKATTADSRGDDVA